MKSFIKKNWVYPLAFLLTLLVILFGYLENINFFYIMRKVIFDRSARLNFFQQLEIERYHSIEPTLLNIAKYILNTYSNGSFDANIILSTVWFQMIIPLFSIPTCITFYLKYQTLYHSTFYKHKNYRSFLIKEIFKHAFKLSFSIFSAYLLFMIVAKEMAHPTMLASESRTLFNDLLGSGFYQNHTILYFILEGGMRFFMMPFIYTCLGETVALLNVSLKYVIGAPLLYYYGLATVGYALAFLAPTISPYINPTAFMANGDYELNTLLLLTINFIPLYLSLGIVWYRSQHVEI